MSTKDKKHQLEKYRLFYELAPLKNRGIPKTKNKRPGRKPRTPKLPDNVLENLE